jgi:hypothetical protein
VARPIFLRDQRVDVARRSEMISPAFRDDVARLSGASAGPIRVRSFGFCTGGADASREDNDAPGARSASFENGRGRAQRDCSPSRGCAVDCPVDVEATGDCRVELAIAGGDDGQRAGDGAVRGPPARSKAIGVTSSPVISEALSVQGRGRELLELMQAHDLEGIVAKRLDDPYEPRVRWLKIKNPNYTQKEGRGKLFNKH